MFATMLVYSRSSSKSLKQSHILLDGRKRKREDFVQANAAIIPEKLLLVSRCLCSCSSPLDQPSLDKTQAKLHRCHKSKQQQQSKSLSSCREKVVYDCIAVGVLLLFFLLMVGVNFFL